VIVNNTLALYDVAAALRAAYARQPGPTRHGFMYEKLDRCHDHAKTHEARQRLRALYAACEVLSREEGPS
jgi:hypothetical protein